MALDAAPFIRTGTRGSPSWPGSNPETGYVDPDCSEAQKPLADGAGHTLRAPFAVWLRALPGRMRGRSFRTCGPRTERDGLGQDRGREQDRQFERQAYGRHGALGRGGPLGLSRRWLWRLRGLPAPQAWLLAEMGFPRRAMRMTVVLDEAGEGHAVPMNLNRSRRVVISSLSVSRSWMTCSSSPTICPRPSQIDKSQ